MSAQEQPGPILPPPGEDRPLRRFQSVLFMCAMHAVRSPMAVALTKHFFGKSAYVQSAGARKGEFDGFHQAVLDAIGLDLVRNKPNSVPVYTSDVVEDLLRGASQRKSHPNKN